ncbi:MAG: RNA-binding cell elongation regulator Jag/EloR [Acidimicrobiales bacterium]
MEWVEASGKSLSEAKEIALDHLGVTEDDAEFVVLSEPKAGLFGRLRGEARVQARVRPVAPPPKRGRRQRSDRARGGGDRSRNGGSSGGKGGNGRSGGGERSRGSRRLDNGAREGSARDEVVADDAVRSNGSTPAEGSRSGEVRSGQSGSGSGSGSRRKRGPRSGRSDNSQSAQHEMNESGRKSGDSEDSMEESLTLEQQGEAATEFVAGLVREFGLDAEVDFAVLDEDTVQVAANGDDLGLMVGPRGATLSAIQDLTRTFVQRQSEVRTDRILVDVGGYREKRSAALRRFAEGIVEEVKSSGEQRALEPMSPADRKVVHDTVNEIEGVETRSDGVEPSRFVVIQPSS